MFRAFVRCAAIIGVLGCELDALSSDPAVVGPDPVPELPTDEPAMLVVGGAGQQDSVTARLATPYCVRLVDASGVPVAGVTVTWSVVSGGGNVDPATSVTDAAGLARTVYRLGSSLGFQHVTASANGYQGSPTTFSVYVYHGAPAAMVYEVDASDSDMNAPIAPALRLALHDRFGHVTDRVNGAASIALVEGTGTPLATASGTLTVPVAAGRAVFNNVRIDLPGYDYRLSTQAAGRSVQSRAFTVRLLGLP